MKKKISLDLDNLSSENCRKLDMIYFKSQKSFLFFLENVFKKTNGNKKWILSSIFSRDYYQSRLYLNLCYLKLIDDLYKKNEIEHLIVQNSVLKKTILLKYPELVVKVKKEYLKIFLDFFAIIKNFLKNLIFIANLILVKDKKRKINIKSKDKIILIETFFIKNMFSKNKYIAGDYPSIILNRTNNEIRKRIFLYPTILINRPLKKYLRLAEKNYENYIYFFDFLEISDYFKSLFNYIFLGDIKKENIYYNSYKINFLIDHERKINIFNRSTFLANINYYFFKRLKENNVKLNLVIDWFENQVTDRGLNLGKNTFFPEIKSKGYMGYVADFDGILHFKPSSLEKRIGSLPNEIDVIGKKIKKKVNKFCRNLKILSSPAFRNQYLFNLTNYTKIKKKYKKKIILIILSGTEKEQKSIFNVLNKIINNFSNKEYLFRVRPHRNSNLKKKEIENSIFEIDKNNFHKSLSQADIVISGGSTASVEAVIFGKKVIIIGNNNEFTINPIRSFGGEKLYKVCYSPEEYENAIKSYIDQKEIKFKKAISLKNSLLKNYFEKLNSNNLKKFLK